MLIALSGAGVVLRSRARYAREVTRHLYRFDQYSVDPATRELRCAGELVVLSPKIFDCIAWLIEHRDRAVGRDELVAAVWGKTDIADTQLVQAMLKARRAVGDSGEQQRVIRTIPRFGYRWVAEVDVQGSAIAEVPAEAVVEATPYVLPTESPGVVPRTVAPLRPLQRTRRVLVALGFVGIVVASGVGFWSVGHRSPEPEPSESMVESPNAAVLPATVGADADWGWLRLGLMDFVAGQLRGSGLTVVPSDNVVALLRNTAVTDSAEQTVRRATGSRWTILPTARRDTTGWTVSLELRDGADQRRVVEGSAADPVAAARQALGVLLPMVGRANVREGGSQDDLVTRVRAALLGNDFDGAQRWLDAASQGQREDPEIRVLQAQTDFGRGRFESSHVRFTQLLADIGEQAEPLLRARALSGRAACAIRLADVVAAENDFDAALGLLRDRSEPALVGQAYSGRGVSRAMQGNDDGAMADFARARLALQLGNDTLSLARVEMNEGALNGQRGHPAEALASFQSAAKHFERFDARNELAVAMANEIEAHLALLEADRALEVSERAQALVARLADPSASRLIAYWRASALVAVGRLAEAREELDALIGSPDAAQDMGVLAMSRGRRAALALAAGQAESAVALARQAVLDSATGPWKDVRGEAWLTLVRALRSVGKDSEAASEVDRFAAWARDGASHVTTVLSRLAKAEQAWSDRQREVAVQVYTDALAIAEREGVPALIARVGDSWGSTLIAEGELEAAGPVVGRLARWASVDFSCALLQTRLYRELGHRVAWQTALAQARTLAGERIIPAAMAVDPTVVPLNPAR